MAAIDQREDGSHPGDVVCLTAQQAEAYSLVFERMAHTAHDDGDERRTIRSRNVRFGCSRMPATPRRASGVLVRRPSRGGAAIPTPSRPLPG